ncbi:hypothetical protein HCN44_011444 [Aphidius gifuensis]|uniref:Glutathione peroxidase n=1 Tax=Aphidius gifuensis TaxID=684658 RepID=A0A835CVA5_APHGI|nr:probable phospholipid hydroperoxide glutathione peroxidase [Aphidius gifuensis]XP_044006809.1 probable phospholipid hydroperoxide glutathione peroxidase [Aphidius gifuensis]KAF7994175.1 hypothetical protein HCN44_011444 [Aphidius gifuensis]
MGFLKYSILPGLQQTFRSLTGMTGNVDYKSAKSIYDFEAVTLNGEVVQLSKYKDHVCLIINIASKCTLTEINYKELNQLYDSYADSQGLRILAFPCNQFNNQEPGDSKEIMEFAKSRNAKFEIFEKVNVNGDDAHPLWKYLKQEQSGTLFDDIKWNFTKFIIDKNGKPVERHGPQVNPTGLIENLKKYF